MVCSGHDDADDDAVDGPIKLDVKLMKHWEHALDFAEGRYYTRPSAIFRDEKYQMTQHCPISVMTSSASSKISSHTAKMAKFRCNLIGRMSGFLFHESPKHRA